MAFAWMVIRSSWKPSRVRYKDRMLNLGRGQLAMSVRDMAAAMDRDKAWVERLWKRLKSETMIETVTDAGVSVVTICNYRSEEHTSELQSLMRISYAVFCLKKKTKTQHTTHYRQPN